MGKKQPWGGGCGYRHWRSAWALMLFPAQSVRFCSCQPFIPSLQLSRPPFLAQVYTVVDEMFLAGEIRETSQTKVLKQLLMLQSLE